MKLVIGLTGLPLSGKETVANRLEALFAADSVTVSRHRFSDILRDTLDIWGISRGRANEQRLAQLMQRPGDGFPEGILARAIKHRLLKDRADVGILDGMRWEVDEKMIREFPAEGIASCVIFVNADEDHRYKRLVARDRDGEAMTTREAFKVLNVQPNEIFIPTIGSRADLTLTNNYDAITEFEWDVESAYRSRIKPLISTAEK